MKLPDKIWLGSFFILIFLSCQQEQGNLTAVSQENVYVFGVWKAPTTKSAKQTLANISLRIDDYTNIQLPPTITQNKENIALKDSDSKHTEAETVYRTLPYSTAVAPETLLPKDDEIADWGRAGKPTTYNTETLYRDRVVPTEIFHHYGFQRQAEVEYQSPKFGSVPFILLEIFDMGTPENAFGIFSVNSYPHPKYEWVGCKAIISGKSLRFWKGKYFIQIEGYAIATGIREGMVSLARATAKKIQDPPQKVPLLELLPTQHIRGSEKLFYTNWALHEVYKSAPKITPQLTDKSIGILAQYKGTRSQKSANPYIVFVIRFPNVTDAQSAFEQYSHALMAEKAPFEMDPQNWTILVNEQFAEP